MNNIEIKSIDAKKMTLSKEKQAQRKKIDDFKLTKWNKVRDCDVIITSSSRPELLKLTLKYLEDNLHFHGNFRFILNEDFVLPKESTKLIKWARNSGYFKEEDIICNQNPKGLKQALVHLIKKVKTPFCLHMQDDWAFERPIELDKAMYMMEHIKEINNILFYKSRVPLMKDGVIMREYNFPQFQQYLTLNYSWELMPGLWRTDFIKPVILNAMSVDNKKMKRTAPATITHYLRPPELRKDMDHLYNNMGVFFWGQWKEPRWCRHIGENARMESWRLTGDGKPGKEDSNQEGNAINNLAHWIPFEHIPKIKGRNSIKILKQEMIRKGKK